MSQEKTHDLHDFMRQISNEIAAEYNRIQKRATEDPGTAGDQVEENWAELLQGWLPSTYKVVTKGRIISQSSIASPQVDVLVLKDFYPEKLLNKKLYLAAGVAAAFECKTTLKAEHIEKAMETCVKIKNLYPAREGTPYKELHAPIVYGLLAHSHSWKSPNSTPEVNISQKLFNSDELHVTHPRECLDLLCIADLGTWNTMKMSVASARLESGLALVTSYMMATSTIKNQSESFTPIGYCIYNLSRKIAWENTQLQEIAQYYKDAKMGAITNGNARKWNFSFSENVMQRLQNYQSNIESFNIEVILSKT